MSDFSDELWLDVPLIDEDMAEPVENMHIDSGTSDRDADSDDEEDTDEE